MIQRHTDTKRHIISKRSIDEYRRIRRTVKPISRYENNIDDDVDDTLQEKAKEYVVRAKLKAREVMNKGYWTGNLSRNIRYKKLAICNTLSHRMQLIVVS